MNFNKNQELAINHFDGNCNVLSTAGSGKTAVLTHRIVNLINTHEVLAEHILAITFSRKAADNMKNKLSKLIPMKCNSINIDTFHSWGLKILRNFNCRNFEILSSDTDRLKILKDIDKNIDEPNELLSYISLHKNRLQPPNKTIHTYNEKMYLSYEKTKEYKGLLDFDDMLIKTYELLINNPTALKYCTDIFKYILIDESQDMNHAQYEIIKLIGKPNNNVFIVGDVFQCIYEWRSSNNDYVRNFHKEWEDTEIINLNVNYRSTKNIVDFSNNFAKCISDSKYKFYKKSVADKASYKDPELMVYINEFDEAFGIAEKVKELVDTKQYDFNDIAILSRTNAQQQIIESVFYNAGLPCGIVDGVSFINRREIKLILSYLKLANNKNDDDSFRYAYCQPSRYLGKKFLEECESIGQGKILSLYESMIKLSCSNTRYMSGINELKLVIDTLIKKDWDNVAEQIKFIRRVLDIDKYVSKDIGSDTNDSNEKTENLDSLEQIAGQYKTLPEFIEYMGKFAGKKQNTENQIKLSTIHKSKGLEWPVVFLVGINDGTLPHKRNFNVEEEKRLCYVGITRPEKELYCCTYDEQSQFIKLLFNNKKRG